MEVGDGVVDEGEDEAGGGCGVELACVRAERGGRGRVGGGEEEAGCVVGGR